MRIAPARPASAKALDSVVFGQHSLACAIIARKLAPAVGFSDPENAYLAGLLHDIGYILNLVAFPEQPKTVIEEAARDRLFMGEVEYSNLGFTHRQTGEVLARRWNLADGLVEVILCHRNVAAAVINPGLVAVASLADRLSQGLESRIGICGTRRDVFLGDRLGILVEKRPFAAEVA